MASKSFWLENTEKKYPSLQGKHKTSTVIIGGGIAGLTTAYYLAKAGVQVMVLEAQQIGKGTTGHTSAHVTSQHDATYLRWTKRFGADKAKIIGQANESAIIEIKRIIDEEKIDCNFKFADSYLYTNAKNKIKKIMDECDAAKACGIKAEFVTMDNLLFPYVKALRFKDQAMFHPIKYVNGLAKAIEQMGGEIFESSRALHFYDNLVKTQEGSVRAENIVIATHNPVINFPGMYFAKMYQHRSYVLALSNAPKIEGMWVSIDPKGHTFRNEGDYLIVCGEDHKCGSQKNVNHYEDLNTFSHSYCPNAKLEYQWSAQDGITLDNLPYIGKYSKGTDYVFVATGFGKWGMTQSNIAGRIICDLILKKDNQYADIYSPQRHLKPIAISNAIVQNTITSFDLVFGQLRFTCPSCAHLKCKLVWNKDEKTWDCPCHGSRFEENGSVIDTPAIHDLKR